MNNFVFALPTKIYFGKDEHLKLGSICEEFGFNNVLIVCGNHTKNSGLLSVLTNLLDEKKIEHHELIGIKANPDVCFVKEGLTVARENKINGILAIGGGSAIDVAKEIAVAFDYPNDPYDFSVYKVAPSHALPIGVILTIAASGSEMSNSCVISNKELGLKNGFNSEVVRPCFSILNPELTYSVNQYQTSCGVADIISHSFERYFNPSNEIEFSDSFSLALIKDVIKWGKVVYKDPCNFDARGALMLDGSYSHNGFTSLGKCGAFTIHKIEHALSAFDPSIAHGAGLAVLMPAWMEFIYKYDINKFSRFTTEVFNINYEDKKESAMIGIQSLKEYFKSIGLPTTLLELGIKKENIPSLADFMTQGGTRLIGPESIKPLTKEDIISILTIAL